MSGSYLSLCTRVLCCLFLGSWLSACGGGSSGESGSIEVTPASESLITGDDSLLLDNTPVENADALESIGSEGGTLRVLNPGSALNGLVLEVPPGAVPVGEIYQFSVAKKADVASEVERSDQSPLITFDRLRTSESGMHPFWGTVIQNLDQGLPLTPVIEFGPTGATFEKPVTATIPLLSANYDPEELEQNISVILGEFESGVL